MLREEFRAGGVAGVGDVQAAGLLVGVEGWRDAAFGEVLGGLIYGLGADLPKAR